MNGRVGVSWGAETMYFDDSDNWEDGALRSALLYSLRAASLRRYPCTHFYSESIFPPKILEAVYKNWPSSDDITAISGSRRVTPGAYQARGLLSLSDLLKVQSERGDASAFWNAFSRDLTSDEFLRSIFDWLWPEIEPVRELPSQLELSVEWVLTEDKIGYAIGPHTDAPSRLATILIYVPTDDSSHFAGTSLYVPKNAGVKRGVSPAHFQSQDFHRVYTAPFLPNSALGFVVSPNSFHGVEKVESLPTARRQIMLFLKYKVASDL